MRSKLDSLWIGTSIGVIVPLLVFFLYYLYNYSYLQMESFLFKVLMNQVLVPLLSLCVVANLGIFFLFLQKNYIYAARGVVMATFLYTIGIYIYKFTA